MVDVKRLKNILIDYCEWNITVDGWVILEKDLDEYLNVLDELKENEIEG